MSRNDFFRVECCPKVFQKFVWAPSKQKNNLLEKGNGWAFFSGNLRSGVPVSKMKKTTKWIEKNPRMRMGSGSSWIFVKYFSDVGIHESTKYQKMLMNLNKFSSFPPSRNLFYECHVVLVKDSLTDSKTASQWTWVGEKFWMDLGLFALFARLPPRLWTTAQLRAHELDTFCRRFWSLLLARAAHVCFAETSSCFCYMLTKLGQGGHRLVQTCLNP